MSVVKRAEEKVKTAREFIGKAWVNVVPSGEHAGVEYINLTLDRSIAEVALTPNSKILLWPNNKREGKKDADYRVSISEVQAQGQLAV